MCIRLPSLKIFILCILSVIPAGFAVAETWHTYGEGIYGYESDWLTSIVLEGEKGVLIMDPYNRKHAEGLKKSIEKRFAKPIEYVVYSHSHADHVRGGDVFAGATFIAQQRQLERLSFLRPYEESIVMPNIVFDKEYRLNYGGREVILRDYGLNHATGITVMHFPADRIVAVADIIYPRRLLWYSMPDYSPRGILTSLKEIAKEDFDLCITTHGPVATRADFEEFVDFMQDMIDQVQGVIDSDLNKHGPLKTLDIALVKVDLSKYKDWGFYNEWRDENIRGVFHSLFMGY